MATHRTARSSRGWSKIAPARGPQRRGLYARCGRAAFLLPNSKKPGDSKYPIVGGRKGRGCQPDCRGLKAAKSRALQQLSRSGLSQSNRKQLRKVAGRAESLARRAKCGWARGR